MVWGGRNGRVTAPTPYLGGTATHGIVGEEESVVRWDRFGSARTVAWGVPERQMRCATKERQIGGDERGQPHLFGSARTVRRAWFGGTGCTRGTHATPGLAGVHSRCPAAPARLLSGSSRDGQHHSFVAHSFAHSLGLLRLLHLAGTRVGADCVRSESGIGGQGPPADWQCRRQASPCRPGGAGFAAWKLFDRRSGGRLLPLVLPCVRLSGGHVEFLSTCWHHLPFPIGVGADQNGCTRWIANALMGAVGCAVGSSS